MGLDIDRCINDLIILDIAFDLAKDLFYGVKWGLYGGRNCAKAPAAVIRSNKSIHAMN